DRQLAERVRVAADGRGLVRRDERRIAGHPLDVPVLLRDVGGARCRSSKLITRPSSRSVCPAAASTRSRYGGRKGRRNNRAPDEDERSSPGLFVVRPAWALSCGWKSRRKETIPIEANRNCGRATNRGKEAGSETAGRCTRTGS